MKGFTLVELMLVVMLLGSLALVSMAFVDNSSQQMGFDQTKAKLEQIRRAIIGDTSRTTNGQPELSGFVADMGRLPMSLSELVEKPADDKLWKAQSIAISGGELYGGWRGPYLETLPGLENPFDEEDEGYRVFRDGWVNIGELEALDKKNYGWKYGLKTNASPETTTTDPATAAHVFVQSKGADFEDGDDGTSIYHKDYPADGQNLIQEYDWRADLGSVEIQLNHATDDDLALKIYTLKNNILEPLIISGPDTDYVLLSLPVVDEPSHTRTAILAGIFLPMGTHAAVVVCADTDDIPYDGTCPGVTPVPTDPKPLAQYFNVIPRSYRPPLKLEWNIPNEPE